MNSRRVTLALMAINLGLVGTLVYLVYAINFSPNVVSGPVKTKVVTNTVTQIAVRKINSTNNLLAALASRTYDWRSLESTNYVLYIQNLRIFGCPEETIRDIIITDVAKNYARRRAELRKELHPYHFWETADPVTGTPSASPEVQRQFRALDKEQRQLIRELLNVDLRTEMAKYTDEEEPASVVDAFLSPEKQEQVRRATEKFDDQEQEIYWRSKGLFLPEDQEALKQIQRERRAELATLLTSEELEEYDLRHSDTANTMRSQLAGFHPTEQEFRDIFRAQHAFEDQFDQAFDPRDDAAQKLKARTQQEAQNALNQEVRKALGPERFAEYQRCQDTDYRALLQIGERYNLAPDVATRVYNIKLAAEQFRAQVSSAPDLSDEQRSQAMDALARETGRAVAGTMGDDVFKSYQQTGGQWLDNLAVVDQTLVPPPPPPQGTTLPYDIKLLPPELQYYLLNPPRPLQPPAK